MNEKILFFTLTNQAGQSDIFINCWISLIPNINFTDSWYCIFLPISCCKCVYGCKQQRVSFIIIISGIYVKLSFNRIWFLFVVLLLEIHHKCLFTVRGWNVGDICPGLTSLVVDRLYFSVITKELIFPLPVTITLLSKKIISFQFRYWVSWSICANYIMLFVWETKM